MKRFAVSAQSVSTFAAALFFAGSLLFTGCSASTISGPDLTTSEGAAVQTDDVAYGPGASHNDEGAGKNGGGSTTPTGAGHNVEE